MTLTPTLTPNLMPPVLARVWRFRNWMTRNTSPIPGLVKFRPMDFVFFNFSFKLRVRPGHG